MCSLRLLAIISAFLIISVSFPQSLFSQGAPLRPQLRRPALRQRQPKAPQRADALASAINELLKLDPLAPGREANPDSLDDTSEEEEKPPADDAPIKDLIVHWTGRNGDFRPSAPKPSDKVRQRLLEAVEDRPELVVSLINFLPETTDTHDRLYKQLEGETDPESYWIFFLRNWLQNNSRYFRDELIEEACKSVQGEMTSEDNLRSLARLEWETAKPILESLVASGNAWFTPVASSLLFEHAQRDGNSANAEKYRVLLKAIVANRESPKEARQTALSGLMATEWNGQEDWFVSLFADPTLNNLREDDGDGGAKKKGAPAVKVDRAQIGEDVPEPAPYFGILSLTLDLNSERWVSVVGNLVGHNQRTVHQSAVRCLVKFLNDDSINKKRKQEVAQKLAPWLTEPAWAATDDRSGFIQSLVGLQAPELLSGLVWVLDHDENTDNRAVAAEALTQYRDPRAIPALRRALEKEADEENRTKIITALAECGGLSDDEMVAAVEAYARKLASEGGAHEIMEPGREAPAEPLPLKVSIGRVLYDSETIQATESLVIRLCERAEALRATQPAVARQILHVVEVADLSLSEINMVERIGAGWADVDTITLALLYRDSLQKTAGSEIYGLIKQGGYARGVAAAILNDEREQLEALKGTDTKAQLALLAGARYLRDKLPLELVGRLLASPSRALAMAAERYLEVEDSAGARKMVLARHPGEAYILGFRDSIQYAYSANEAPALGLEEKIRREIKNQNGPQVIFAAFLVQSPVIEKGVIVRVRNGKGEISVYETEGRRNVRWLTPDEFEKLKEFTSRQEVEDLGPEFQGDSFVNRSSNYQYLRLTKDGGRRIVLDSLRRAPKNPTLHEELSGLFYRLSRSGEFVTRYAIEDKISGVEVLFADDHQRALMVCGEGGEIRALITEKVARSRRNHAPMTEWHDFSSGRDGGVTAEPPSCRYSTQDSTTRLYATHDNEGGIMKVEPGKEPVRILSGVFNDSTPLVTPDGKWLVAVKLIDEEGKYNPQLIRHNLQNRQEFKVIMQENFFIHPLAYVRAHGKVLLGLPNLVSDAGLTGKYSLLDPETGIVQFVKGEFRPLGNSVSRPLQPTESPHEFWAAIYDPRKKGTTFGRYDSKNFSFTPLIDFSELRLKSDDIWADAARGKIWITYQGHLLRAPMPAKTK